MTDMGALAVISISVAIVICAYLAVLALNNWILHIERMRRPHDMKKDE